MSCVLLSINMEHSESNLCVFFQAYSLVDREVGYCQGSAFIVGLLLMQVMIKYFSKMIHNEDTMCHCGSCEARCNQPR